MNHKPVFGWYYNRALTRNSRLLSGVQYLYNFPPTKRRGRLPWDLRGGSRTRRPCAKRQRDRFYHRQSL
ncbi:MAG: hypothetical protein ACLSAP_12440 [Oscillospiraceae bacterium]